MMSEIEKLYINAGVKKDWKPLPYGDIEEYYPEFTAEKQIEIIKFLIGKHARFDMFKDYDQKDLYMVYYECRYFPRQYFTLKEALAESINHLWQDLTDTEKAEIKRILE